MRRQAQALAPANLAGQAAATARDFGALLQEAANEFRAGLEEKQAELSPLLDQR
jgi:hypothetical protein